MKFSQAKKGLFIIVLLIQPMISLAQYTSALLDNYQEPPGTRWKQFNTGLARVIYPDQVEEDAKDLVNTIYGIYPFICRTSSTMPKQRIILRTGLAESNGFATLVPRKIEFFNVPPQANFGGACRWYNLLALHELRHSAQFAELNRGFNAIAYYLAGNEGLSVMLNIATPNWFFEGDAVHTETVLSLAGRGREPRFDAEMRSLLLSGKKIRYNKWIFGSYKDWIPYDADYSFGYQFVSYFNRNYGQEVWRKILRKNANWSFLPYQFETAVYFSTGKNLKTHYKNMIGELTTAWQKQLDNTVLTGAEIVTIPQKKNWTYNLYPKFDGDDNIIMLRWSQDEMFSFIAMNLKTREEKLLYSARNISWQNGFSLVGNKLIWTAEIPDLRWGARSYSDIFEYDIITGKRKRITYNGRYAAPALSPGMKNIAVVDNSTANKHRLIILDATSGMPVKSFSNVENNEIQTPAWSPDGKFLVFTQVGNQGKCLTLLNVETGIMEELMPWSMQNISFPFIYGDKVYFNAYYSGIDNIYCLDMQDKSVKQVSSRPSGAYYPGVSQDGKSLIFSDATSVGFMACIMDINPETMLRYENITSDRTEMFISEKDVFKPENILGKIPENNFSSRTYSKVFNTFNFHSWGLTGDKLDQNITLYVKSANVLNTMAATLNTTYNQNEKTYHYGADISFGGLYPLLDGGFDAGQRSALEESVVAGKDDEFQTWNESTFRFGCRIPLNLSGGKYTTGLQIGLNSAVTQISEMKYIDDPHKNNNGKFFPVSSFIRFTRGTAWLRDIAPVWGQSFSLNYRFTPFGGDYTGRFASGSGRLYFPGLLKHHGINIDLAYEWQDFDNYIYSSMFLFPRGYSSITYPELFKAGVNYVFPLVSPEISIFGLVYSKRIVSNLFYDYGTGFYKNKEFLFRSTGIELLSETYLFRIAFPFYLGARFSLLFDPKPGKSDKVFEFILNTGF